MTFNQWLQQQYFSFKSIIEQSFISYHHAIHQLAIAYPCCNQTLSSLAIAACLPIKNECKAKRLLRTVTYCLCTLTLCITYGAIILATLSQPQWLPSFFLTLSLVAFASIPITQEKPHQNNKKHMTFTSLSFLFIALLTLIFNSLSPVVSLCLLGLIISSHAEATQALLLSQTSSHPPHHPQRLNLNQQPMNKKRKKQRINA